MTSDMDSPPNLDPKLYEEWDDEDDLQWKAPLAALLADTQSPLQIAQAIDSLLRTETSSRLQKLNDYAASHHLSAEDRESGEWMALYAPNATALAHEFIRLWCRVCTAFHPHSEGQDRLVAFLEELKDLPRWMAPESRPDEKGEVLSTEFWKFGKDWVGLEDDFRRENDNVGSLTHIPESCTRWVNLQSAMARVTANGLIYCAPFTALQKLVSPGEPNSNNLEFDILAAAQWVMWPQECRYIYLECLKKETTEHYWEPWSKQKWATWKYAFRAAAEDAKDNDRMKDAASRALRQMEDIEMKVDKEASAGSGRGGE
ncbi:hypothetical protein BS50DRAFT_625398 [Corynespora cassiicola Philippines]|uniref:Uncharacterized protein n=1 Tax=Corynespora cassiicola Philippines TaxID=1448308 RepID=A0A2T2N7X3_CORCC|nr:hypothetical protein BS50DRAFT_625398 [Corynespora cassiicola Philippines]